ncbi:MAG: hypothetical protein AAF311_16480, partial [Pseudomonadota bacterium]
MTGEEENAGSDPHPHAPLHATPTSDHEVTVGDLRMIVLPAGRCDVDVKLANHAFNVCLSTTECRL